MDASDKEQLLSGQCALGSQIGYVMASLDNVRRELADLKLGGDQDSEASFQSGGLRHQQDRSSPPARADIHRRFGIPLDLIVCFAILFDAFVFRFCISSCDCKRTSKWIHPGTRRNSQRVVQANILHIRFHTGGFCSTPTNFILVRFF